MKEIIVAIIVATAIVNILMSLVLSGVGGEFRRSVRASIISALLANFWALGALLIMLLPLQSLLGLGRYLFLIAPVGIMYWLIIFAEEYPFGQARYTHRTRRVLLLAAFTVAALLLLSAHIVMPTSRVIDGLFVPTVNTTLYGLYAVFFALFSYLYSSSFLNKLRHMENYRKKQAWFAYSGTLVSSFVAFLTNLILPIVGFASYIWTGPASSFIYAISFLYAMRRYRLFELRRFAITGIAYVVTLGVLILIYASSVGLIRNITERSIGGVVNGDIFYAMMTVIAVLLYSPLKRFFDRITKTIFFKNEYEIQDVIDSLGSTLLRSNDRKAIIDDVGKLLRKTLLTDNAIIVMADGDDATSNEMRLFWSDHSGRAILALDQDIMNQRIIAWMRERGHEVIAAIKLQSEVIGWIILGSKRSGNAYQRKDITLISIMSDEIAIAMESAAQYEQIQRFNDELKGKIKDATVELRDSNKRLRAIDASKDEFISMASHQLRTPLTSIKGYISMLLEGDLGEITPQQRKALEEAYNSSQRMVYLIGDFLNLSRLQTGRFELERTPVSLPHIIAEEIAQLRAAAEARGVTLQYDPPASFPEVLVDENKIRQVMMNFIDNAIYYAKPTGGVITVSLLEHTHHVSFRVRDNGIGVPAHERPHLFMKFYRAANARKARPDGTGIGLYMAKKVIIAHGGTILFESKEGQGSEFGFRLPTKNPSI